MLPDSYASWHASERAKRRPLSAETPTAKEARVRLGAGSALDGGTGCESTAILIGQTTAVRRAKPATAASPACSSPRLTGATSCPYAARARPAPRTRRRRLRTEPRLRAPPRLPAGTACPGIVGWPKLDHVRQGRQAVVHQRTSRPPATSARDARPGCRSWRLSLQRRLGQADGYRDTASLTDLDDFGDAA